MARAAEAKQADSKRRTRGAGEGRPRPASEKGQACGMVRDRGFAQKHALVYHIIIWLATEI